MKPYYEQDGITIIHGDCCEVLPTLDPVDLVLTDPPYGLGDKWTGGTWGAQPMYGDARKWDKEPPSVDTTRIIIAAGKDAILWGGNYFSCMPPCRGLLAWFKTPSLATMADFEVAWTTFDRPSKSMTTHRNHEHRVHPTQKPLTLMRWCIEQSPNNPATILDPFMGSGTTLVAAKQLHRKAIGIEIEERYCEIAVNRLAQGVLPFGGEA